MPHRFEPFVDLAASLLLVGAAAALTVIGLVLTACGGAASSGKSAATPAQTADSSPQQLADLIDFQGPAEITYRTSEFQPGYGPGTVIWRLNGPLNRWDTLQRAGDSPTEGSFNTYNIHGSFGCEWSALPGDRAHVLVDCGREPGGSPSFMEGELGIGLYKFTDAIVKRTSDRVVLKRNVPCYTGRLIQQICIDERGYVLYFVWRSGSRQETLEATQELPVIQPFGWPFDAISSPTPAGPAPEVLPADQLQLPVQFHLQ